MNMISLTLKDKFTCQQRPALQCIMYREHDKLDLFI